MSEEHENRVATLIAAAGVYSAYAIQFDGDLTSRMKAVGDIFFAQVLSSIQPDRRNHVLFLGAKVAKQMLEFVNDCARENDCARDEKTTEH